MYMQVSPVHLTTFSQFSVPVPVPAFRDFQLPPFPFSWDDNAPQKSCSALKEENILPNKDDGHHLHHQMMNFLMEFFVNELKGLSDPRQFLPSKQHPPAHKSMVIPMKLLFLDEKYTDENI